MVNITLIDSGDHNKMIRNHEIKGTEGQLRIYLKTNRIKESPPLTEQSIKASEEELVNRRVGYIGPKWSR